MRAKSCVCNDTIRLSDGREVSRKEMRARETRILKNKLQTKKLYKEEYRLGNIIDLKPGLGQEWEQELEKVEGKLEKLEETKKELFVSWPQDPHRYKSRRKWWGGPPSPPKNYWGFTDKKALYFLYE